MAGRKGPTTFVLAALLQVGAACAPSDGGQDANELPTWTAVEDLRVGSVDDSATILTAFRSMEVGSNGRMYTLHPMEQLIWLFDAEGNRVRSIGRRGDGPGEFQNAYTLGWVADTLWVLDFNGYRFNQFSPDGEFLGSFSVPFVMGTDLAERGPPRADGLLFDGTVHGSPPAFSSQVAEGVITHHVPMLLGRDGTVSDSLLPVPFGRNQWAISDPDDPRRGGFYMSQPYPDGPLWGYVPGERAMVVLERRAPTSPEEAEYRLTKVDFGGDTVFSRAYPFTPVATSAQEVDSILDATAQRIAGTRFMGGLPEGTAREWAARDLYHPPFMPPVSAMVLARNGEIWLKESPAGEEAAWRVVSRDGDPLGRVLLPRATTVIVTDGHTVWGTEADELDVPYLVRYAVPR
jgi:hypothetical protein